VEKRSHGRIEQRSEGDEKTPKVTMNRVRMMRCDRYIRPRAGALGELGLGPSMHALTTALAWRAANRRLRFAIAVAVISLPVVAKRFNIEVGSATLGRGRGGNSNASGRIAWGGDRLLGGHRLTANPKWTFTSLDNLTVPLEAANEAVCSQLEVRFKSCIDDAPCEWPRRAR